MADPASCGAIPADVRECPLKIPVWSAEWHLLYCLVQNQVLQKTHTTLSFFDAVILLLKGGFLIIKILSATPNFPKLECL